MRNSTQPLAISDFSLHSIGVILFRYNKHDLFATFCEDLFPSILLKSLSSAEAVNLTKVSKKYSLDFDDSYQLLVAKVNEFKVATLDQDFRKVEVDLIHFL